MKHIYLNYNGGLIYKVVWIYALESQMSLTKLPLKLGHGWVIITHKFLRMYLRTHDVISLLFMSYSLLVKEAPASRISNWASNQFCRLPIDIILYR